METIPTAEEFFLNNYFDDSISQEDKKLWLETNEQAQKSLNIMIGFAKLHCEAQEEIILKKIRTIFKETTDPMTGETYMDNIVDKQSILTAYPSTNIK
jgi:hypothetical protein